MLAVLGALGFLGISLFSHISRSCFCCRGSGSSRCSGGCCGSSSLSERSNAHSGQYCSGNEGFDIQHGSFLTYKTKIALAPILLSEPAIWLGLYPQRGGYAVVD